MSFGDVTVRRSHEDGLAIIVDLDGLGEELILNVSRDDGGVEKKRERRINMRWRRRLGQNEAPSIGHCTLDLRTGEVGP
jgi:hypothetical protein